MVYLIVIILFSCTFLQAQEVFSVEDVSSWVEDVDALKGLSIADKKIGWDGAGLGVKGDVVNGIVNLFRPNSEIKLIGFENGLKWGDGLVIGNGEVWVDLEKINKEIIEVEYVDGDNRKYFVFRLKDGGEIEIGKGSFDENGNYINEDLGVGVGGEDRNVKFNLGEGKLRVTEEGEFIFSGGAKVIIDGREFVSGLEGEGSVKIVEGDYFRIKGVVVNTGEAVVNVGEEEIDLIFKEGDYSSLENYVQIYEGELKSSRADPDNPLASINQGRILNIKGENIEVEIKRDIHEGVIDGENIVVKNGEIVQRFDGAKTFVNRKGFEAFLVSDLVNGLAVGGGEIVTEVVGGEGVGGDGVGGGDDGEVRVEVDSKKWVCIGKFCDKGDLLKLIVGADPSQEKYDYDPNMLEAVVTQTNVYAREDEVQKMLDEIPAGLSKQEFGKSATKYLKNNKIVSTVVGEVITKDLIDKKITDMLAPLGLSPEEVKNVKSFKSEVYSDLSIRTVTEKVFWKRQESFVPTNSEIITLTNEEGSNIYGTFTITLNDNKHQIKIPERKIQSIIEDKYRIYGTDERPITLDELYYGDYGAKR